MSLIKDNDILSIYKYKERESYISKEEAVMLQGIAVSLMVFHHLFAFPERVEYPYKLVFDFNIFHFETMLAYLGRICIAFFIFLSGYGMTKISASLEKQKMTKNIFGCTYKKVARQLFKFYMVFWRVFFVFIPIGFINGNIEWNPIEFVKNLLGCSCTYNYEWWYIRTYVQLLLLFPILYNISKYVNKAKYFMLIYVVALFVINRYFCDNLFISYVCNFVFGILCVRTKFYEKCYVKIKNMGRWGDIFIFIATIGSIFVRMFISVKVDTFLIVIIIFGICYGFKSKYCFKILQNTLSIIGKYSAYIWLMHTFFSYYYFQKITYKFYYSWLIWGFCIGMCIFIGMILNKILTAIRKLLERGYKEQCH